MHLPGGLSFLLLGRCQQLRTSQNYYSTHLGEYAEELLRVHRRFIAVRYTASNKAPVKRRSEMTDPKPPSDRDEQQDQEKWYERTRYQVLLFAGGIALFVLVGGLILDWYIEPKTSGQKKDLVQALGLITAGVAGAVGI